MGQKAQKVERVRERRGTEDYGSRNVFPLSANAQLDELPAGAREQPPRRILEQLEHTVSGR